MRRIYHILGIITMMLIFPAAALSLPDAQLLVNQSNPLPAYLGPEPLVPVSTFARGGAGIHLREDAALALEAMLAHMKEEGLKDVYINSGYRSFVRQNQLYTAKVASYRRQGHDEEKSRALAARWVLPAGESEHQTGLAVDISCSATRYDLIPAFAATATGRWLAEHCAEYGFIIRYTEAKENITGVAPEPWHFRYVGPEHAAYMQAHDLCLEEYHELLQEEGRLSIGTEQGRELIALYSLGDNSASLPGEILSVSLARKNSGEYIITALLPLGPLHDTVNHWGEQQIRRLFEMEIIAGYEDGSFRPDNTVNRGEFITIVSRLPIWEMISSPPAADDEADEKPPTLPFIDIDAAQYYYQPLQQCFLAGLVQPMIEPEQEQPLFQPTRALLRREAALMLATLLADENFELPSSPTYTDVPPAAEALFRAVELLTFRGVFRGDGLGYFYPEREISRAEICAMLTRLLEALETEQTAQIE